MSMLQVLRTLGSIVRQLGPALRDGRERAHCHGPTRLTILADRLERLQGEAELTNISPRSRSTSRTASGVERFLNRWSDVRVVSGAPAKTSESEGQRRAGTSERPSDTASKTAEAALVAALGVATAAGDLATIRAIAEALGSGRGAAFPLKFGR